MKYLFILASVFSVFLSSFSKNNDGLDVSSVYYNDAIDDDTIALHSPVNLRLNDFIYNPYGFLKPKYKELTYTELLRYLTAYHTELSINEESEGDKLVLRINKLKAWSGKDIKIKATFDNDSFILTRFEHKVMLETSDIEHSEYYIYKVNKSVGSLTIFKYDKEHNVLVDINGENHICVIEGYFMHEREEKTCKYPRIKFRCIPKQLNKDKTYTLEKQM